jgi:hypothetical protein
MFERGECPQRLIEVAFDPVNNGQQILTTWTMYAVGAKLVHQPAQIDHSRERKHGARILFRHSGGGFYTPIEDGVTYLSHKFEDRKVTDNGGSNPIRATITCPACGHTAVEEMRETFCQFFYECRGCAVVFRPKQGDCCVFCSYSDRRCPPRERGECRGIET